MAKCNYCAETMNIEKITIPVERRGKIVTFRKISVCPSCLEERYPEYTTINLIGEAEPKTYQVSIRGKKRSMRGRTQ